MLYFSSDYNHQSSFVIFAKKYIFFLLKFVIQEFDSQEKMRWEKLWVGGGGPGKRWGHTCNATNGGRLLYVFGGYGKDNCQTNQVHVFDTVNRTWTEPLMKGVVPVPRDSHSCTNVGDNLFVFGGTDGRRPLKDLLILDTASNTWISPIVRGDGPEAREGHSAALIGKRLFIFGGCGKYEDHEVYYDDLYILNTETFVWKCVVPSGAPPSKRDSHTCSSWMNKIIVIGGEDACDYYLSDVHILDADTLVWCKLNTAGQLLPPRAGHTTIALGKYLFVFGGFSDEQNLYDDVYMLDIENGVWTKIMAIGERPSGRFSMAGDTVDPQLGGVLAFVGGCNKNLEALDDMYYLHTGLVRESDQDGRRLSMKKRMKLKCQEANAFSRVDNDVNVLQPLPVSTYVQPSQSNFYLHGYQPPVGKKTFQATVTKSFPEGYSIETIIDGKPLRGVLLSNKPIGSKDSLNSSIRQMEAMHFNGAMTNDVHNATSNATRPPEQIVTEEESESEFESDDDHDDDEDEDDDDDVDVDDDDADADADEEDHMMSSPKPMSETSGARRKSPNAFEASQTPQVTGDVKLSVSLDTNMENNGKNVVSHSRNEIHEDYASTAKDHPMTGS